MRSLFFGSGERKLYGTYHPGSASPPKGASAAGVVLCYPGVQEYNVCHGAFRKLAMLLARSGLHVLRFDYFGTGDSAGVSGEGEPETWVTDIRAAAAELRELANIRLVSLVGYRLGATLAACAVSAGLEVGDLVLWDPVVNGAEYVRDMEVRDRQQNLLLLHPTSRFQGQKEELLGYPFPLLQRTSLERIDLRTQDPPSAARRVMLMVSENRAEHDGLRASLSRRRSDVHYQFVSEPEEAMNRGAREEVLLANKILAAIRDAMIGGEAPS